MSITIVEIAKLGQESFINKPKKFITESEAKLLTH